jgi:ABC-type oligopeptide transport system substrate-binding subunit
MLPDPERWLSLAAPIAPHWYPMEVSQAQALTNDPVSRMSTYSQAENWVLQRGLIIPLASGNLGYLVKPAVQSLEMTPAGPMPRNNNWSLVGVS